MSEPQSMKKCMLLNRETDKLLSGQKNWNRIDFFKRFVREPDLLRT